MNAYTKAHVESATKRKLAAQKAAKTRAERKAIESSPAYAALLEEFGL